MFALLAFTRLQSKLDDLLLVIKAQAMKRLSGPARYRILIGLILLILFYYAFRNYSDYSNRLIHEVNLSSSARSMSTIHVTILLLLGPARVRSSEGVASPNQCLLRGFVSRFQRIYY